MIRKIFSFLIGGLLGGLIASACYKNIFNHTISIPVILLGVIAGTFLFWLATYIVFAAVHILFIAAIGALIGGSIGFGIKLLLSLNVNLIIIGAVTGAISFKILKGLHKLKLNSKQ